jgi:RNA polymerase sigma-70 factor (ECF subfamily)
MQETLVDAYIHLAKFENRASFKTWLLRIMLNNCFKKQHKWSAKHIIAADLNEKSEPLFSNNQDTDTNKTVMNKELNTVIENALQTIPDDYRVVFSLREANGLNVQETAEVLHISEANVKVRLNRAKAMLRKEIEKSYSFSDIYEFNLIYCDAMVKRVMDILEIR